MSIRETRELMTEVFYVSLFLTLVVILPDLFSSDTFEVKVKEAMLTLAALVLLSSPFVYSSRKSRKEREEINRKVDERNRRKEEAAERGRLYEENYANEGKALKKLVLDDLEALAEGKTVRINPKTIEALKALQTRQAEHSDTVAVWGQVIEDLRAGVPNDPKAMPNRIDDLLYPDTLEDVEALKKSVSDNLKKLAHGERPCPEGLKAARALNEIRARDARKKREEEKLEAQERREQKERDDASRAAMAEIARNSATNIARMHGLPGNAFDGLSPGEALIRVRTLREIDEFLKKSFEEREQILQELESANRRSETRRKEANEQDN